MAVLRRVALGLLLAASAAVLLLAALELWNYRQWAYLPTHEAGFNEDDRARILQDRMDFLTKRVGDMELLVLILLGTSGLYAIVFVASSYFSAASFTRQAGQTINTIQDQIGLAMGDLRELQEQTEQKLNGLLAPAPPSSAIAAQPAAAQPAAAQPGAAQPAAPQPSAAAPQPSYDEEIAAMTARLAAWKGEPLGAESTLGLLRDESAAAHLDAIAGSKLGSALPALYLGFSRVYARSDPARSRFYLDRALRLAPPQSALASEIHYELACQFAVSNDFPRAMGELTLAFEHQFRALDERLASDIEEGGQLYELASTPPFDRAINDLLLNMSIGIG
jgi:hypothetical protein